MWLYNLFWAIIYIECGFTIYFGQLYTSLVSCVKRNTRLKKDMLKVNSTAYSKMSIIHNPKILSIHMAYQ